MRNGQLPLSMFLAGMLGTSAVGFGCSDAGSENNPEGAGATGGVPMEETGGAGSGGTPDSATGGVATGVSVTPTGGATNTGGALATGGVATGGGGPGSGGSGVGGSATGGAGVGGTATGGEFTGTCTESQDTGRSASGSGPHDVVIETNPEDGIRCGTIYRPADLGGSERYPILVWGEGGCSQDGLSNQAAMSEIASWGYFVVADGTPGGDSCAGGQDGAAFLDYVTWAIAENDKPCSAYYQSLEPSKIAADGFSCGGLMALNVSSDSRFTAVGITSSGLFGPNAGLYDAIHTPFKIMNGGPEDIAYENGLNDYDEISARGIPIVYFAKLSAGHGGDLFQARGEFNLVNLAWLNWQLKGDEGATGKGFLHGSTCEYCTNSGWEYQSANIE